MSYIDEMNKLARKKQIKESKAMMRKILGVYEQTFAKLSREWIAVLKSNGLEHTQASKLKQAYMVQVHSKILDIQAQYGIKASTNYLELAKSMYGDTDEFNDSKKYNEFNKMVDNVVDICNEDYLKYMYSGSIYKDGKGLSSRIWESVGRDSSKLEDEIMSCIGKGMASKDMVKYLGKFIKSGNASYNAMRIGRTTYCHMSQLAMQDSARVNPYIQGIKWHSVHAVGRTCAQCKERDGQVYEPKKLPFDHPNGMCYMTAVTMLNGKEATATDIAKDLKKWLNGEPNSGIMDKWYKQSEKKVEAVTKATKAVKATTKITKTPTKVVYKEMLQSECREWSKKFKESGIYKNLSKEERRALREYTGSAYRDMNGWLRFGKLDKYVYDDEISLAKDIEEAIKGLDKLRTKDNIQVHRGSNINAILGDFMKDDRFMEAYEKAIMGEDATADLTSILSGTRLTDKGFMSTSINKSSTFGGGLNMHINVPKGSSCGGYVNGISKYEDSEYEFLMKPGTTVEITKAWGDDEGNIHVLCDIVKK